MSWEHQKENIQPLPQGRKICELMKALSIITDNQARKEMIEDRRKQFDEDCEKCQEDLGKQLELWHKYIDWLEQHVPDGGKVGGLMNTIEECIEKYYNRNEFKQDMKLFDIFMKFKQFCDDPAEIFTFMYANSIGTLLANFYLNWSWQYEIRKNMKRAEDLIRLGLKNLATPREALEEALKQIRFRLDRMIRTGELDDVPDSSSSGASSHRQIQAELASGGIRAALQTLKSKGTKKNGLSVSVNRTGIAVDCLNVGGLKSQTKIVNGVRVPKNVIPAGSKLRPRSNKPIEIFNPIQENVGLDSQQGEDVTHQAATDENALPPMSLIEKVSQARGLRSVGRSGVENSAPVRSVLATKNKPAVLLD